MKKILTIGGVVAMLFGGVLYLAPSLSGHNAQIITDNTKETDAAAKPIVTLYKDIQCSCCDGYAQALRAEGYEVVVQTTQDMQAVKAKHNIPPAGESCHTSVIGNYVVEGHVPLDVVAQLIQEKPDVAGIGLPGMPAGTPGMPGVKSHDYEIYELSSNGEMSPYITI